MFLDPLVLIWTRLGLGFRSAMYTIVATTIGAISYLAHLVARRFGLIASIVFIATVSLAIYRRLNAYAGYGTPPLPVKEILKPKLYSENKAIRVICLSDTHNTISTEEDVHRLPDADVLIHCGDFTNRGTIEEIERFNTFLGLAAKRFPVRVVIAGNHDLILDPMTYENNISFLSKQDQEKHTGPGAKSLPFFVKYAPENKSAGGNWQKVYRDAIKNEVLTNATHYLENETVTISIPHRGSIIIAGSPVTELQSHASMQSFARSDLDQTAAFQQTFSSVPSGKAVDIFMSHGPPRNILDRTFFGKKVGSLARFLVRLTKEKRAPQYHTFGHLHEQRGVMTKNSVSCGSILKGLQLGSSSSKLFDNKTITEASLIPSTFMNCSSINLLHHLRPETSAADPGCAVLFDVEK